MKTASMHEEQKESASFPARETDPAHYHLRLFVTGATPRSLRAIQNIRAICEDYLQGRYDLEVVDIYQHPEHAKAEQIVVTPTLFKQAPLPVRKLIGDLSDIDRVLAGLDIASSRFSERPKSEHAAGYAAD